MFSNLLGKKLSGIYINQDKDEIIFITKDNEVYRMYHDQDCCEHVSIEDICGDLNDLLYYEITEAEESTQEGEDDEFDSSTWTFYKLSTRKGTVTIRWFGESNGYYSESVDFIKIK